MKNQQTKLHTPSFAALTEMFSDTYKMYPVMY